MTRTRNLFLLALGVTILVVAAGMALVTRADSVQPGAQSNQRTESSNLQRSDVPRWVTRPCHDKGSVNCRIGGEHPNIRRQVPGSTHMVCVFYVKRADAKRWDYCS